MKEQKEIKTIHKWNEINEYNELINRIIDNKIVDQQSKSIKSLYYCYGTNFWCFIVRHLEDKTQADKILYCFFKDIANHPKDYLLTDGNVDVELFLKDKLRKYIENWKGKELWD